MTSYRERSADHAARSRRIAEELARCESAVARLRSKAYLASRDWIMMRVYERLIARHRRALAPTCSADAPIPVAEVSATL